MLTIKILREEKGISQSKLAEKTGISPRKIFSIEKGESKITIEDLQNIAKALNEDWFEILKKEFNIDNTEEEKPKSFNEEIAEYKKSNPKITKLKNEVEFLSKRLADALLEIDRIKDHINLN